GRPKPEPGTVQQAQRAGMRSAEPEAAEWLTIGALTGAAPALLPAPAPTANRSTAMTNNNLRLISFLPRLPPQAIGPRRCTITRAPLMTQSFRIIVPTCSPRNAGSSSCGKPLPGCQEQSQRTGITEVAWSDMPMCMGAASALAPLKLAPTNKSPATTGSILHCIRSSAECHHNQRTLEPRPSSPIRVLLSG